MIYIIVPVLVLVLAFACIIAWAFGSALAEVMAAKKDVDKTDEL